MDTMLGPGIVTLTDAAVSPDGKVCKAFWSPDWRVVLDPGIDAPGVGPAPRRSSCIIWRRLEAYLEGVVVMAIPGPNVAAFVSAQDPPPIWRVYKFHVPEVI